MLSATIPQACATPCRIPNSAGAVIAHQRYVPIANEFCSSSTTFPIHPPPCAEHWYRADIESASERCSSGTASSGPGGSLRRRCIEAGRKRRISARPRRQPAVRVVLSDLPGCSHDSGPVDRGSCQPAVKRCAPHPPARHARRPTNQTSAQCRATARLPGRGAQARGPVGLRLVEGDDSQIQPPAGIESAALGHSDLLQACQHLRQVHGADRGAGDPAWVEDG